MNRNKRMSRIGNRRGHRNGRTREPITGLMSSKNLVDRPQPLPVKDDLVCQHRGEVYLTWTGANEGTAGTVNVSQLISTLPGNTSTWDRVQFHRIDVYGAQRAPQVGNAGPEGPWPYLSVTLDSTVDSNFLGDQPTFYSDAVKGNRRAHVGIRPNTLFSNSWIPTDRTEPLLTINTAAYSTSSSQSLGRYECVIQFTVMLRSRPSTDLYQFGDMTITRKPFRANDPWDPLPVQVSNTYENPVPTKEIPSAANNNQVESAFLPLSYGQREMPAPHS